MGRRSDIEKKRATVHQELRASCIEGHRAPGEMLPPVRELAEQYGVSSKVAWQAIQVLVDEGVLHTVSRMGTFVGKPQGQFDVYLLVLPHSPGTDEYFHQVQIGFEERVAQLGGVSLRLTEAEARQHQQQSELPPLVGLCRLGPRLSDSPQDSPWWPADVPLVEFGILQDGGGTTDKIHFDDIAGGRQAAQHLLAMGHQKIAYLALHTSENQPEDFFWSVDREIGWAQAMKAAGCSIEGLAFHPVDSPQFSIEKFISADAQLESAQHLAREQLVARRDITAIVTANIHAARGLLLALDEAKIPAHSRPAILCFDDVVAGSRSVVSYLRLPWDEVGRTAAQLLWERKTGQLSGPPQQRLVQMRLIPRLTCHSSWKNSVLTREQISAGSASRKVGPSILEVAGV